MQEMLTERLENWQGNILQAATFSVAHIGYYPLNGWSLFVLVFPVGIAFDWLKMKRQTLVVPWIANATKRGAEAIELAQKLASSL